MIAPADAVLRALLAGHGPQNWWPAEGPFEIMVGAVLVQRTTWTSAETAIARLKVERLLEPERLSAASPELVETCVRSAGFFRTKAARLRSLAGFVVARGGVGGLSSQPTAALRSLLLGQAGIGPETADAILLYAFGRPAVVVDAYLRRLARRLEGGTHPPADARLRAWAEDGIADVAGLGEFHALVIAHGRQVCGTEPRCAECRLAGLCLTAPPGAVGSARRSDA